MADISKVKSLDGTTTYNVKDATARSLLNGHSVAKDVPSDAKFTDTTYSSKTAASGGTDVSLVTTGEKYTWNNKGSGTITGIKMNGASKGSSGVVDLGTVITAHQDISGKMNASLKGAANGVAELDSTGKVPSSQLPSYVDDVLEYDSQSAFPTTGEAGKIYVAKDTNKTYRWSGTAYVEISPSLALGETSSTAYRGDRGKTAYDHSQSTHARTDATAVAASSTNGNIKINGTETTVYTHPGSGTNPHGTTKSDVGLGNVGNFKAVSTAASQGLTDTEKSNARANIGAGTSSLALGTSSSTAYRGDRGNSAYAHAVTNKGSAFASGLYKITTNSEGHVTAATAVEKADITGLGIPESDTNTHRPIQVNGTEVLGNNTTALNLKAGSNVTVTNSSGTVTIAATDTTYSSKTATSGGTDVSLVTTGEKYTWNHKGSYSKPSGGIPKTDLDSAVQTSLGRADTALRSHQTIKQDGITGATINRYGTCSTAAATAQKEVTLTSGTFSLETGAVVRVKFTDTNTVASPTLKVGSTDAKSIMRYGTTTAGTSVNTSWNAGEVVTFIYDGTNWLMADFGLRGNDNTIPSAYCSTAAGTAAKTAACTDYNLTSKTWTQVLIKNANSSASKLTLAINGKTAKDIYINGTVSSASNYTLPAGTYLVYYDGTGYQFRTDGLLPNYVNRAAASGGTDVSLVTTGEKYTWNNKGSYSKPSGGIPDSDIASASTWNAKGTYSKPSGGIPKTDLASAVQTSLGKADSALQSHQTIKQDGVTGATVNRFGTCSTAAATAAKTVSITTGTFSLEAGAMVAVKFSNANSASSPTLNVASTGAKNIFVNGAQITTNSGAKGLLKGTVIFIYDGTQYHLIGNYYDSNTHRPIQVNGTEVLGNNTTALNLKAGSNVSVTNSSGTVTIAATDTTYSDATTSAHGLMTAADKTKLNALVNLGLTLVGSV